MAMARRQRRSSRHAELEQRLRELNVTSPAAKALAVIARGRGRSTATDKAWRALHEKFRKEVQVAPHLASALPFHISSQIELHLGGM
jgi:hypothetical protein